MKRFTIQSIVAASGGAGRNLDAVLGRAPRNISTDTRSLKKGEVFLALRGDTFDGHDFVHQALALGAVMCIVDARWMRANIEAHAGAPMLVVRDTGAAYGAIARAYRDTFRIPVIGLTGSNGKTSTREMIAAALATSVKTLQTRGNLNNQIGVPRTLLRLDERAGAVVVEMGTNQPGDIAALCGMAGPTIGVVTNIGRAHIERLLSREGIAREKGTLYGALPADGVAVVNGDEPLVKPFVRRGLKRVIFGTRKSADVRIAAVALDAAGRTTVTLDAPAHLGAPVTVRLRALGRHAAWNAAAALATAIAAGCAPDAALAAIARVPAFDGRMEVRKVRGLTIINDAYNANPDSMLAALDTLAAMKTAGARIAVLGDMLELGRAARDEHRRIGEVVAELGIPYVLTFGAHSRAISTAARPTARLAAHFTSKEELCGAVLSVADRGDIVLFKGSRGMRMDEVAVFLQDRFNRTEA